MKRKSVACARALLQQQKPNIFDEYVQGPEARVTTHARRQTMCALRGNPESTATGKAVQRQTLEAATMKEKLCVMFTLRRD